MSPVSAAENKQVIKNYQYSKKKKKKIDLLLRKTYAIGGGVLAAQRNYTKPGERLTFANNIFIPRKLFLLFIL